ncbi:expressed unknown protein [Seminavis robusta]|uniref:Uncharacterized protein n=1 Tax=Seminavis robusta TaxID=568900 RepID=A0A9N8DQN6_9STRA|nr:expressed unknown protein [Seminavis robusta]|eukprot:Sro302_g112230.1 n/a (749) ;mRNA; r:52257-54503
MSASASVAVKTEEGVAATGPREYEFYKLPPGRANKFQYPPSCPVHFRGSDGTMRNGVVLEVGLRDVGEPTQKYKLTTSSEDEMIVEEGGIVFGNGCPVWWTYTTNPPHQKPGWIHSCTLRNHGEKFYTIRLTPEEDSPITIPFIPENSLKFNFTAAKTDAPQASSSNQQQQPSRPEPSRKPPPQKSKTGKQHTKKTSGPATSKRAPTVSASVRDSDTSSSEQASSKPDAIRKPSAKSKEAKRQASKKSPTANAKDPTRPKDKKSSQQQQSQAAKKQPATDKQTKKKGKQPNQPDKQQRASSTCTTEASFHVPRRPAPELRMDFTQHNYKSDDDDDDASDTSPSKDPQRLKAIKQPTRNVKGQQQQRQKQSLAQGMQINQSDSPFSKICYSVHHDMERAQDKVREFIRQKGRVKNPYNPDYKGLGPVLYKMCWHWHLQGQCYANCKVQKDHRELTPEAARKIEAALEPAISMKGPIFLPAALEEMAKKKKQKAKASPDGSRKRTDSDTERDHEAGGANGEQGVLAMGANARKKQKLATDVSKTLMLPKHFGEVFYQSALHEEESIGEYLKKCIWVLKEARKGIKLELSGSSKEQLIQCQWEAERILCEKLRDKNLACKLLMDLERLNKWRNPDAGDQVMILKTRRPMARSHDKLCWMAEIKIQDDGNDNGGGDDQPVALETAQIVHNTLQPRYGDKVKLVLHSRLEGSCCNYDVPSHFIVWGKDRRDVDACLKAFREEAEHQEDDPFEF